MIKENVILVYDLLINPLSSWLPSFDLRERKQEDSTKGHDDLAPDLTSFS